MGKSILIISQSFYPEIGSAGNRMKNIFQLLTDKGYKVSVITTEPTYPNKKIYMEDSFWNEPNINNDTENINRIKVANRKYSRSIFNRLLYYLEIAFRMLFYIVKDKRKFDVIFVSSPPIFIGIVGLIAKFRYKSQLILDIRDLWPESLKGVGVFDNKVILNVFGFIEKLLYIKSDQIIVNSYKFKKYIQLKAKVEPSKIGFMPNSARLTELSDPFINDRKVKKDFKVIYTGNIGLAQDVEILKALASNLSTYNIKLSIIGYGIKRSELKEYITNKKLTNVQFYSPVTRKECFELNMQHQVGFVSLNDKEVFDTVLPGKLVDYMTCGLPIVASVSGYSKDIIEKEKVGLVSTTRDIHEIIGHILFLYHNSEVREEFSKNSKEFVRKTFLWEQNIQELINRVENISLT